MERKMGLRVDFTFSLFIIAFVNLQTVASLTVSAVASETLLGENATFQCRITYGTDETGTSLTIFHSVGNTGEGGEIYMYYFLRGNPSNNLEVDPSEKDPRYSFDAVTQTMLIRNVNCADEVPNKCLLQGQLANKDPTSAEDTGRIYVKVQPKKPKNLVTIPANLTEGLAENSTLKLTCNANIGRDGKGSIVWRVYRNNIAEDILPSDDRVSTNQASLEGDDVSCSVRQQTELTLTQLSVADQDLVVACFVKNDNFQPEVPASCTPTDMCQQSEKIKILYGVRSMNIAKNPEKVYEGSVVTLTCNAQGWPQPTYTWFKGTEGDANNTLVSSERDYIIADAQMDAHEGVYFCEASNKVGDKAFTIASNSVRVNVEVRPTTQTTQPSTAPSTQSTTDGGGTGGLSGDGSDGEETIIIVVVVVVVVALIIAGVAFYCWRTRRTKGIKEESLEKPQYNNRTNLAYQTSQPDLVTVDHKKPSGPSPNNSFDMNEDGLRYADLTYDNRPRSRKPMAIGDTSSEYSDIQMPQV